MKLPLAATCIYRKDDFSISAIHRESWMVANQKAGRFTEADYQYLAKHDPDTLSRLKRKWAAP